MGEIQGTGAVPPDWRPAYNYDFAKSVDLFQQSLQGYETAQEVHKKAKFKEVMEKTLQIMNETARSALSKAGQDKKDKLEKDYQSFIEHDTPANYKKLNNDIENLKDSMNNP